MIPWHGTFYIQLREKDFFLIMQRSTEIKPISVRKKLTLQYCKESDFSNEEKSNWIKFSSKIAMFRAIFAAVLSSLKDLPEYMTTCIEQMLNCGSFKLGCTVYQCPKCGQYKKVPFTCHTRLCCSCGNLTNKQRANAIAEKMFDVKHRHAVFTIPEILRPYFFKNHDLINLLFEAAYETVYYAIHRICPKLDVMPGMIAVCHTFSRSSRWNPHIHAIITVGGITRYGKWFTPYRDVLPYALLRKKFQIRLLKKLRRTLGPSFIPVQAKLMETYPDGFYVHAPRVDEKLGTSVKGLVKYLARYLGRPCIASSRIDGFDGKYVYYHYNRHPDDRCYYEKVAASDFVLRLLQHLPDKNFKMVRYYGIYSNAISNSKRVTKALNSKQVAYLYSKASHEKRVFYSHWRSAKIRAFHVDPLECPCCKSQMVPLYRVYKGIVFWNVAPKGARKIRQEAG